MATADHTITYHFNLGVNIGELNTAFQPVMDTAAGMTDETATALLSAWMAAPWPQGASAYAYCTKHNVTDQMTEGNPNTGEFT